MPSRGPEPDGSGKEGSALAAIAEQYLADLSTRARPKTVTDSRRALERLARELGALTVAGVRKWRQARLAEGASHKTVNTEVGVLRAALNLAVQDGLLPQNPLAGLRALPIDARHMRRRPRALSDEEIARLLDCAASADRSLGGIPRLPLVRALLETGARYGELVKSTWSDLDRARGTLTLRGETTKTARSRAVPLTPALLALVDGLSFAHVRVKGALPLPTGRIFLSPEGHAWPAESGNFRRHLSKLYREAGIPLRDELGRVANVHTCRHTFTTRHIKAGTPLPVVQRLLGHTTPQMVLRVYAHVETEQERAAILGLPALPDVGNLDLRPNEWPSRAAPVQADNEVGGSVVSAEGIEPSTCWLKARSSTERQFPLRVLPPIADDEVDPNEV